MILLDGGDCSICGKYFSNSMRLSNHENKCFQSFTKRHTCIICNRKRYERYMKPVLQSSWACKDEYHFQVCCDNNEILVSERIIKDLKKFKYINMRHIVGK